MTGRDIDWRAALRRERENLGLTQVQLGSAASLSPETVRKYERGTRTPTRDHLAAILRVLQVPQARARAILADAGFAPVERLFPAGEHPGYFYSVAEAAAEIDRTPWPQFVVGNVMEIVAANTAAGFLWGVDVAAELAGRRRAEMHFLALMAEPRFAARIINFEECLAVVVGVLKGVPEGGAALDSPGPWAEQVLGHFASSNPAALASLLHVWERTPPQKAKSRWTYRLVWREPEGEIRFRGVVSTASEPEGLSFNDWTPADAESHAALERVLAARIAVSQTAGVPESTLGAPSVGRRARRS